ncbi:MAG: NAD(P)H-binding protein [Erythrobacter sp.]|nr:NAD(P)H-binding protein [Erythrobacter sp.]
MLALTGGTGFVGSTVLDEALAQGWRVRALTRREQPARDGVDWVRGTLADETALAALCAGVGDPADAVLHVAGLTRAFNAEAFEAANVEGTAALITAVKAAGVARFVLVSSLAAREPLLSAYGASKARAETLVRESGLDWSIVRPPAVYGPRDTDMLEVFRTAKLGIVPLPPRGATSIIHAEDLARLLLALAERGRLKHTYEPDDGREGGWGHRELAQAVGRAIGKRSVFAPHLPEMVLRLAARADRLVRGEHAKLTADRAGYLAHPNWVARSASAPPSNVWEPLIEGEEGLKSTAAWYRAEGWL